jgi:hypothetical protein
MERSRLVRRRLARQMEKVLDLCDSRFAVHRLHDSTFGLVVDDLAAEANDAVDHLDIDLTRVDVEPGEQAPQVFRHRVVVHWMEASSSVSDRRVSFRSSCFVPGTRRRAASAATYRGPRSIAITDAAGVAPISIEVVRHDGAHTH